MKTLTKYEEELVEVLIRYNFSNDVIVAIKSGLKTKYQTMYLTDYLLVHPTRERHMLMRVYGLILKKQSNEPGYFEEVYRRYQRDHMQN